MTDRALADLQKEGGHMHTYLHGSSILNEELGSFDTTSRFLSFN
jgi:hypothetical protein